MEIYVFTSKIHLFGLSRYVRCVLASLFRFSPIMPVLPEVSIVVPCFNEDEVLPKTLLRLHQAARQLKVSYEILLVDDGSSDRTWELIEAAHREDPTVRGFRFARNFGHQAALTAGVREARGTQILVIDADLQDPPELLGPMREKMAEGYDIVYGQRRTRSGETWFKLATAKAFYRTINFLSEIDIPQDTGDFRLVSRRAADAFLSMPENNRFIRGMFAWVGFRQFALLYDRDSRSAGQTKFTLSKMLRFSMDAITSFSIRPLRLASLFSVILVATAVVLMVWTFFQQAHGATVRGWASLIVTMLFIGGIQTFILGIVGEYIGRLVMEAKKRPLYIVGDTTDPKPDRGGPGSGS